MVHFAIILSVNNLICDKIRWRHDEYEKTFINPIKGKLETLNLSFEFYAMAVIIMLN